MPLELKFLVWSVALTLVQVVVAATGAIMQVGVVPLAGNREGLPPIEGWAGRALGARLPLVQNRVRAPNRARRALLPALSLPTRRRGQTRFRDKQSPSSKHRTTGLITLGLGCDIEARK